MGKGQLYLESEAHKNYLSKLITDQWTEEEWLRLRQQGEHRMDARKQTRKGPGTNNVSVTKVGQMDGISTRSRLWNPRILLLLPLLRLSQGLVCGFRFILHRFIHSFFKMEPEFLLMRSARSLLSDGYESVKRPDNQRISRELAQGLSLTVSFRFSSCSSTLTQLPPSFTLTRNNLPLHQLIIRTSGDV